jgi:hypothetical protein
MSRQLRRTALATVGVVAIAAGIPAGALADQSTRVSSNRVLYVASDAFPSGQTRPSKQDASFTVISASSKAGRLELTVDGHREPDRYFSKQGSRGRVEFALSPDIGWHELAMTIVDADGARSAARTYSFGVRPGSATKTALGSTPALGGRFTEADGSPAVDLPVAVYPVLQGSTDGAPSELTPLATTRTAKDGTWSVTLASIPKAAKDAAAANDGVLNLQAVADGVARDPETGQLRQMTGVSSFATGISIGGKMSDAAVDAAKAGIPTAPLLPVRHRSELTRSPEQAPPADVRNPEPTLTAEQAQYNQPAYFGAPDAQGKPVDNTAAARSIGASDYTSQPIIPASADESEQSAAAAVTPDATGDECTIENALVTKRTQGTWGYTTMLESHAYQDSWGGVDYSHTAGSSTTMGISYNSGAGWSVNGTYYLGNDFGISTGFTKGPYWSYQWRVPVQYGYYTIYDCKIISGVKRLVYKYNVMRAESVVVPNGAYAGIYGSDVSSYDGYYGWSEAPYNWRVTPGTTFAASVNSSNSQSGAITAFGFSVTTTTAKSTSRQQRYTAGNQSVAHYLFAYEEVRPGMKVFYSY